MPMGVLKAVLYAQSASSNLVDQSVLDVRTIFSSILFNSLFDTSTCPLVCGWYGVAILCFTPNFVNKFLNSLLQKCVPPSLMIARGDPKRVKIFFSYEFHQSS